MLTSDVSSSIPQGVTTDLLPGTPSVPSHKDALAEQLEGMFASILIKTMRETLGETGLFPGDSADILGSLFDQHMGEQIAASGGLGVAENFRSKL